MDINSLLSPEPTPTSTPSPRSTPINPPRRPTTGTRNSNLGGHLSPLSQAAVAHPAPSQPMTANNAGFAKSTSPTKSTRVPHRSSATSGIDTLADLASMQHSQRGFQSTPTIIRTYEGQEKQPTAKASRPSLESIARAHSGSRSSLDIHMEEAPMQIPESRAFTSSSLSEDDLRLVQQLTLYLAENPNAYESHLQLIKILHQGFLSHVYPTEELPEEKDPTTYDLLPELRQAREAMASRFAMGEEAWIERMQDETLLARTLEDCLQVVESFEKAVAGEVGSTKLWVMYGDWVLALYSAANPSDELVLQMHDGLNKWIDLTENDLLVIAEVFAKPQIIDVWKRGAEEVKYNINYSNLVWDKYTDLLQMELGSNPSNKDLQSFEQHLRDRLQTPHPAWDATSARFSTFISTYNNTAWEQIMVDMNKQSSRAKALFSEREEREGTLARSLESGDKTSAWTIFNDYLEWEFSLTETRSQPRNKRSKPSMFSFDLANALYQRATLLFPSDINLWEGHAILLGVESAYHNERLSDLPLLQRACDHCPWSGKLWSLYIETAERQKKEFVDIHQIKHKATSTGLLDSTSLEDGLTIYTAWCSFLRRRAFIQDATDEDADVAEMGIRAAIEDVKTLGKRKEGKGYNGDPQYRLERIYIKFLAQIRKFDDARAKWKELISQRRKSHEFWLRYYAWEMNCWSFEIGRTGISSTKLGPKEATKVLLSAAREAAQMDWPEKVLETYLIHCQDHEDIETIEAAKIVYDRTMKEVTKRRQQEAVEYASQQQAQAPAVAVQAEESMTNGHAAKRKREDEVNGNEKHNKKARGEDKADHSTTTQSVQKRDRENSTVIVKNLPEGTPNNRIQQYFSDCGTIKSILMSSDDNKKTAIATVEFESNEDALAAITRDQKVYEGKTISVRLGTGTTLYVTNFPPEGDEDWIRDYFKECGEIIDVRFPSLKYNTQRRFCYVQFKSSEAAQAAKQLNGSTVDGDLNLVALVSDPSQKDSRHGAVYEGREIYVKNIDWRATEDDLEKVFSTYGSVERVRIPKTRDGKSKGFAYVVLSTKEEAESSLELNDTNFQNRVITVVIADPNPTKRSATTVINSKVKSASPAPDRTASPEPSTSTDRRQRTIALLNIPDTINAARLKSLLSPHGTIEEITLRPTHSGAIIVFATASEAGIAALNIEGYEIAPGRNIQTGSVADLYKQKADIKDETPGVRKAGEKKGNTTSGASGTGGASKPTGFIPQASSVRRPGLGSSGAGRRGGLGQIKRPRVPQVDANAAATTTTGEEKNVSEQSEKGGKSNDEFRKMISRGS